MKRQLKVEITEIFMAKADWNRCFHGIIKREKDENGVPVLSSKIYVKNEKFDEVIFAKVSDANKSQEELQDQLGEQLDEMVIMILDRGLNKMKPVTEKIGEFEYSFN